MLKGYEKDEKIRKRDNYHRKVFRGSGRQLDRPRISAAAAERWTIIHGSVSLSVHICPSELQCCALAQNTELTQTHLHRSKSYDCMRATAAVHGMIIICKTARAYCSLKSITYKRSEKLPRIHNPQALTSVYVFTSDMQNLNLMAVRR